MCALTRGVLKLDVQPHSHSPLSGIWDLGPKLLEVYHAGEYLLQMRGVLLLEAALLIARGLHLLEGVL